MWKTVWKWRSYRGYHTEVIFKSLKCWLGGTSGGCESDLLFEVGWSQTLARSSMTWSSQVLKSSEDRDLTASLVMSAHAAFSNDRSELFCWDYGCCPCVVLSASTHENLAIIFVLDFTVVVAATRSTVKFPDEQFQLPQALHADLFCSSLTHLDSSFMDLW